MAFGSAGRPSRRAVIAGLGVGGAFALGTGDARAHAALDALVERQMAEAGIPGLALGLARDGLVVAARGYGAADLAARRPVDPETLFHVASITKTVTAMATVMLADEGRIALDQPIAERLDFEILGDAAKAMTWRHLLMHTSGISDRVYYEIDFRRRGLDSDTPLAGFLRDYLAAGGRYVGAGNIAQPPGARWDYSNVGYGLLGHLAERVTGQDLRAWIGERLFAPLGLTHTAWRLADVPLNAATPYDRIDGALTPVAPVGFPDWPAGMLRASVTDLTRLAAAVSNGGAVPGRRILGPDQTGLMLAMHRPEGLPDWLTGQGLGWQQSLLDGVPRINHWGGDPGVFTMAYVDPATRRAVVALSNLSATAESRAALKAIVSAGFRAL